MKIRKGSSRTVFLTKRFAFKFPTLKAYRLFLHGLLANSQEKTFSGSHPDLAEVLFSLPFGLCVVMKRASEINVDSHGWDDFTSFIAKKYKDDEMSEFLLSDLKPSNWGYVDGNIVKIDYGS